jgi:regulator of replication initiation timing
MNDLWLRRREAVSDVLGMTPTEFVLYQENRRLKAENEHLKSHAGPENIFSAAVEPSVQKMRDISQQLNIAVRTYCRDDGYGYHVIGQSYSGLSVAYYTDRTALMRLSDWAIADMMKQQLEMVTRALIENLHRDKGLPTIVQNLDESPSSAAGSKI